MTFKTGDKGKTRGGDDYEVVYASEGVLWVVIDGMNWFYRDDGVYREGADSTLLPPKQKIEGFIWVYKDGNNIFSENKPDVWRANIIAVVPITIPYEIGEGLDTLDVTKEDLDYAQTRMEMRVKRGLEP